MFGTNIKRMNGVGNDYFFCHINGIKNLNGYDTRNNEENYGK